MALHPSRPRKEEKLLKQSISRKTVLAILGSVVLVPLLLLTNGCGDSTAGQTVDKSGGASGSSLNNSSNVDQAGRAAGGSGMPVPTSGTGK